ncbi:MAG: cell envelope integrity protein TolA [Burkholderiales bacterium]|nr:cell envelope integrity protein TolA [Burkholderiales bacterium]
MHAAADRPEFVPPPQAGLLGGLVIALLAHLLLLLALMWGVQWKRDSQDTAVEAELWASVPQEAAPQPVVVAPPPPPPPQPVAKEEPKPEPKPREPDINVEREKQKREAARREALEEERERKELARKKAAAEKEKLKREQEKLAADLRKKEAEDKKRKEKLDEDRRAKLREENLKRMQGLAGGSDSPTAKGAAQQSSGPSASWAGRVRGRVKPNIVFTDDVQGNPSAEVEVRLAPDGTIVSRKLVKSSGHKAWDDAVLRALDKTEVLPRDTDGRVPPAGVLVFRPKD